MLLNTEAHKDRVSNFHQDIIHAVHMYKLNASSLHVCKDAIITHGCIEPAIAIRRARQRPFCVQYELQREKNKSNKIN
jgi:hypothetical protein